MKVMRKIVIKCIIMVINPLLTKIPILSFLNKML